MSNNDYISEGRTTQVVFWITGQMLRGMAWAAAFVIAAGFALWAIYGIGLLLPEESKQAPAPMGALEWVTTDTLA
jgi:hypothetical protein